MNNDNGPFDQELRDPDEVRRIADQAARDYQRAVDESKRWNDRLRAALTLHGHRSYLWNGMPLWIVSTDRCLSLRQTRLDRALYS